MATQQDYREYLAIRRQNVKAIKVDDASDSPAISIGATALSLCRVELRAIIIELSFEVNLVFSGLLGKDVSQFSNVFLIGFFIAFFFAGKLLVHRLFIFTVFIFSFFARKWGNTRVPLRLMAFEWFLGD